MYARPTYSFGEVKSGFCDRVGMYKLHHVYMLFNTFLFTI